MLSDERIAEIAETHIGRLKDIGHKSGLVIRTDAELACESAIRNALAEAAQSPAVPVMGEAVAFGSGDKIVGVGTYKNVPAVFVMPAPIVGVVGERAGDIYSKDSIIACEFVLTFPTGNQAQAVADALCNATSITQAEIDALLNAARALDALLDRELHVLDKEVVFPFESHTQAWNHIVDARQIASEAAAIAKERKA